MERFKFYSHKNVVAICTEPRENMSEIVIVGVSGSSKWEVGWKGDALNKDWKPIKRKEINEHLKS